MRHGLVHGPSVGGVELDDDLAHIEISETTCRIPGVWRTLSLQMQQEMMSVGAGTRRSACGWSRRNRAHALQRVASFAPRCGLVVSKGRYLRSRGERTLLVQLRMAHSSSGSEKEPAVIQRLLCVAQTCAFFSAPLQ